MQVWKIQATGPVPQGARLQGREASALDLHAGTNLSPALSLATTLWEMLSQGLINANQRAGYVQLKGPGIF